MNVFVTETLSRAAALLAGLAAGIALIQVTSPSLWNQIRPVLWIPSKPPEPVLLEPEKKVEPQEEEEEEEQVSSEEEDASFSPQGLESDKPPGGSTEENQNLLSLLYSIAEDQARKGKQPLV